MSQTAVQEPAKARLPLNGVDTPKLFATINAVGANPPLAKFQFRARNSWVSGTHSRGTIETFYGAGSEMAHQRTFTLDADHPAVLDEIRALHKQLAGAMAEELTALHNCSEETTVCN
jgi:hypothetical protein